MKKGRIYKVHINFIKYCILLILFFLAFSCDNNQVFDEYLKIPGSSWNKDKTYTFHVNIYDTLSPCDVNVNVRHSNLYSYSNLFLFVSITAPDGNFLQDTLELSLAGKSGKWFGKGVGNVLAIKYPYQKRVRFPVRGIYTFDMEQGMREENLQNILDIGLRIEKSKPE